MEFTIMKAINVLVISGVILFGAAMSVSLALARDGHGNRGYGNGGHGYGGHGYRGYRYGGRSRFGVGVFFGGPIYAPWAPWYYPAPHPYYYPPAVAAVPASPPVYIERGETQAAPEVQNYWYYCPDEKTYYPYVKQCPGGWQRVVPQQPPR
jgi:hypothetical protein